MSGMYRIGGPLIAFAIIATFVTGILPAYAGDAKSCVRIEGKRIVNRCDSTITVTWCVEAPDGTADCDRGFNNQVNIRAGNWWPMNPVGAPGRIHYGACAGPHSIRSSFADSRQMVYRCD